MNKFIQRGRNCMKYSAAIVACAIFSVKAENTLITHNSKPLSFNKAIKTAQINDPWLTGNVNKQRAIEAMSNAVSTLPDPKVSIGLANLPTDGFDFSQENMTQAKVGISQMFPRGDTVEIKGRQLKIQSQAYPFQRKDRESKVAVTVGSLWLEAYRVQQSIALIEKNRSLFEQLVDVSEASYSSAIGKTRQQDIVRAQLELTRLEDRLSQYEQQKHRYQGMLAQWLTQLDIEQPSELSRSEEEAYFNSEFSQYSFSENNDRPTNVFLNAELPQIVLINQAVMTKGRWLSQAALVQYFSTHPAVIAIEKKVSATKTGIALAKQKYQPEWGVNASYGYRADDPMGRSRADLLSVGVTFDLPLFTEKRQDNEVQSAIHQTEAVKTEKLLLLKQLLGNYSSAKGRLLRLKERQKLYRLKLLPQIHDQAEASLTAYTNDDGDFSEVVRARIAVLNAEIDELNLNVDEQKIRLELNYLFIGTIENTTENNQLNLASLGNNFASFGEK